MNGAFCDNALDASLNYIKNIAENLYVCSALPTTFLEASNTYKLGVKALPTFTGPAATLTGRALTVDAVTNGVVSAAGWAYYIAITDDSNSELLYVRPLNTPREIVSETVFTLASFLIGVNQPA